MKQKLLIAALTAITILNAGAVYAEEDYVEQCRKEDFSATWHAIGLRVDEEGKSHTFRCYLNVRENGKIPKNLSSCFDLKDPYFDLCKRNNARLDKHCNVNIRLQLRINNKCSRKFLLTGNADQDLENMVAEGIESTTDQSMILQAIRHSEAY